MKLYEAAGDDRRPFSNRPYSWRIVMALAHKSLPVERIALPIVRHQNIWDIWACFLTEALAHPG